MRLQFIRTQFTASHTGALEKSLQSLGDTYKTQMPRRSVHLLASLSWWSAGQHNAERRPPSLLKVSHSAITMHPSCLLLLLSLSTALGDFELYQRGGFIHSEKIFSSCFFWSINKNPHFLTLAHQWDAPIPIEIVTVKLEKVFSFESEFYLRTYDPEGVVFYGDADAGNNWFVLALRNGRPEIQISNEHCRLVVSSGNILNDGIWRKIAVNSQKNEIVLTVDDKIALVIAIFPSIGLDDSMVDMRIALGGLLINESSLLVPLRHSLDACIVNWNWLQQNTSWIKEKVARNPNLQCHTDIMTGSFFPGLGMAVFRCSDLLNASGTEVSWSLSFEVVIRPNKHNGLVMALLTGGHDPLLKIQFSLQDNHEQFKLSLGTATTISIESPARLCDGQQLNLTISESEATLQIGDQRGRQTVDASDFAALKTSWFNRDTLMFLGGVPGLDKLGYDWYLYAGCMQDVRLQGVAVDFNQVLFKHDSVSSHSCPAPKQSSSPSILTGGFAQLKTKEF
ncbi:sex hormone-binding globulin [Scyliorhinus torazame]|uniref:sex hormone-binding globulin n=1 Tax=Scyliorhinus torazame TaxID=75743 RepID=UPI003B5BCE9C